MSSKWKICQNSNYVNERKKCGLPLLPKAKNKNVPFDDLPEEVDEKCPHCGESIDNSYDEPGRCIADNWKQYPDQIGHCSSGDAVVQCIRCEKLFTMDISQ